MNKPSRYKPRSFAETLIAYCKKQGGELWNDTKSAPRQSSLSRLTGIAQPNFTRWLSGAATPDSSKVQLLARRLGLSTDQLLGLEPIQGIDSETNLAEPISSYATIAEPYGVPLLTSIQAGQLGMEKGYFSPESNQRRVACPTSHSRAAFAMRVDGDSMISPHGAEKSYPPGAIIFVDPNVQPQSGSKVVVKLNSFPAPTFKVLAIDAGQRYLRPINPQYPTVQMPDDAIICGVVIGTFIPE